MYHYFVSTKCAERIVKLDNPNMDKRDIEINIPQVEVACNVWLNIVCEITNDIGITQRVRDMLYQLGLVKVMRACKSVTQDLLSQTLECSGENDLWSFSMKYIPLRDATHEIGLVVDKCRQIYSGVDRVRNVVQCLQFLVRFTYYTSVTSSDTFQKFFKANDKCKAMTYDWGLRPGYAALSFVKFELARIFTTRHFHYHADDGAFSSGTLRDHVAHPIEKWKWLAQSTGCYKGSVQYPLLWGKELKFEPWNVPFLTAVPKSFDEKRIIAPEGPIVNYYGHAFLEAIRRMLVANRTSGYINEDNQAVNRLLALDGSVSGEWCTIDMSSASDTITRQLFLECIPPKFANFYKRFTSAFMEWVPSNTRVPSYRKIFLLFTSGNPVTWITEACWFLAIGRAAAAIAGCAHPEKCVYAFGDDLIVKQCYYETTIDLLQSMGHTVNVNKSYGQGFFRESCGGWYYQGSDVTPTYWPRRVIMKNDLVWTMCDLQHKLFSYSNTKSLIEKVVLDLDPGMTFSPQGDECDDLWIDTVVDRGYLDLGVHRHRKVRRRFAKPDAFTEHLAYYQYLEFGPMYESALDELLQVSSSRLRSLCLYPEK